MTSLAGFEALLRGRRVVVLRPAVLCRLGADRRTASGIRSRPAPQPRRARRRHPDPLSALSRSADPAALRAGTDRRAARTAGIVARRAAGAGAAPAGRAGAAARRFRMLAARQPIARVRERPRSVMRAPYRVVAITGASSGLGAALARSYAGPQVALGLIGAQPRAAGARPRPPAAPPAPRVAAPRSMSPTARRSAAWLAEFDRAHPVELLIANAGISAGPDAGRARASRRATTLRARSRSTCVGAVNTIAPLVPAMCARGRGRVVAIASVAAFRGLPYSPGYCASKAGAARLCRGAAAASGAARGRGHGGVPRASSARR